MVSHFPRGNLLSKFLNISFDPKLDSLDRSQGRVLSWMLLFCFCIDSTMAKLRHSRLQARKWSTVKLVLSMLFMLSVVLLMLLGLGIFSLPIKNYDFAPNDLTSYRRMASERWHCRGCFNFYRIDLFPFLIIFFVDLTQYLMQRERLGEERGAMDWSPFLGA